MSMAYGGIYCYSTDSHIRVTLVRDLFPIKVQKIIAIFVDSLVLLFSVGGGYAMYYMATRAVKTPAGDWYMQRSGSAMNSVLADCYQTVYSCSFLCTCAAGSPAPG